MNFKSLLVILGLLLLLLSLFLFVFGLAALIFYSYEKQATAFFSSALITLAVGAAMRVGAHHMAGHSNITYREGMAVASLGWIIIAFFGALPAFLSGDIPTFTDAYFESMSGFTTTGASILTDIASRGHTVLLWRSFSQWLGGMGIIVLYIALLPALGAGSFQLFKAEVPGPTPDKIGPRVAQSARNLYLIYVVLSMILMLLFLVGGMSVFETLCHAFSTVSTAGFSPLNASIAHYNTNAIPNAIYFEWVMIIFMFISAVNFSLHWSFITGNYGAYRQNPEFRFFLAIVVICAGTITLDLVVSGYYTGAIGDTFRHALFATVSISTTSGFVTEDFDRWPNYSRFLLLYMMVVGGCAGSTSGGMKVLRFMTLAKEGLNELKRTIHPNLVYTIRFGDHAINRDVLKMINAFFIFYIMLYGCGILILATTGFDFETLSTAVLACLSNIGPALSKVGPSENYASMPVYAKWVLSFFMVLGRLELFPVLAIALPKMWRK